MSRDQQETPTTVRVFILGFTSKEFSLDFQPDSELSIVLEYLTSNYGTGVLKLRNTNIQIGKSILPTGEYDYQVQSQQREEVLGVIEENLPTYFCPLKTASKLPEDGHLASLNFPMNSSCFHPYRKGIELIKNAKQAARHHPKFQAFGCVPMERIFSQWTFQIPKEPEELYCRQNLDNFMELLTTVCRDIYPDTCKHILHTSAKIALSSLTSIKKNSNFASSESLPDPTLCGRVDSNYLGLVTSEAKAVNNSCSVAYGQAIQIAAECAVDLLHYVSSFRNTSWAYADITIPFIACAGNKIQFGVVFLIEVNFPNSALISKELDLLDPEDRLEIMEWMLGISALVNHNMNHLQSLQGHLTKKNSKSKLYLKHKFLKPIEVYTSGVLDERLIYSRATTILQLFKQLWDNEATRDITCFPEGFIGYPNYGQNQLLNAVDMKIQEYSNSKDNIVSTPGHLILIYPDLVHQQWNRAEEWLEIASEKEMKAFLDLFIDALEKFESVGVIHTDPRPSNVFVKGSISTESSSSASPAPLQIKFIDWDDCFKVDSNIPLCLRERWSDPIVRSFQKATNQFHAYYVELLQEVIAKKISQGCVPGDIFQVAEPIETEELTENRESLLRRRERDFDTTEEVKSKIKKTS